PTSTSVRPSRLRTPPFTSSTNLFRHALRRTNRSTARPDRGVQRCFLHRRLADSWPVSVDGGPVPLSTQRLASAFPYVLVQKLCHSGRPETGVHTNSRNSRMPSR